MAVPPDRHRQPIQGFGCWTAATKAMGRYLAVLVYHMLQHGRGWVDQGMAQFEQKCVQQELARSAPARLHATCVLDQKRGALAQVRVGEGTGYWRAASYQRSR